MRNEVKEKLDRLPLKYFDGRTHGEILSRVTNDMDTIATTLQQSMTQLITSVVTIVGILIMMISISPVMTLIALVTLPACGVLTMQIAKKSQKYFANQQKSLGELNGHVEEMYTGHKIVKVFGREKESIEQFKKVNEELYHAGWKDQFMSGIIMPALNFVNNLGYVFVCIIGGLLWIFSAYLGGAVERIIRVLLDLLSSIPMIFLIIGSFYLVSSNTISIAGILALTALPEIANVVKVTALELRTEEFVTASIAMGGRNFHIIHRHIWPNLLGILLVQGVGLYSRFTLMMASLGYIGLLSFPSWGFLVQMGQKEVFSSWWSPVGPALGLVGIVLLVNAIGRQLSRIIGEKVRIDV
jgi:ABC-type multidrug transport system fused ATPase/permease subunit